MARVDADAIEANYQKTLDLLMDTIRPTVQIAFNDMLITGRGGIIFDGKGVRAVQPGEWEPTTPPSAEVDDRIFSVGLDGKLWEHK